jgi:hypothetical protein
MQGKSAKSVEKTLKFLFPAPSVFRNSLKSSMIESQTFIDNLPCFSYVIATENVFLKITCEANHEK